MPEYRVRLLGPKGGVKQQRKVHASCAGEAEEQTREYLETGGIEVSWLDVSRVGSSFGDRDRAVGQMI